MGLDNPKRLGYTDSHMDTSTRTPDHFDRTLGALDGLPDTIATKPTTLRAVTPLIGNAQTFIVQTIRQRDSGDTIFLEYVDAGTATRIVIPPAVADAIARQRDTLTTRARSKAAKAAMAERKGRGEVFGFQKKARA